MRRHVGFAFRQSIAPWVAFPAVVLFCLNAYQRAAVWRGDAFLTIDAQSIPLFILGPLLVAAVATDTARASRPGAQHHVALTKPVMRPYLFVALAGLLPCLAVIWFADILAFAYSATYYFDPPAVPSVLLQSTIHAAVLVLLVAVGSLLGRILPAGLAGLIGAVAGLALLYSAVSVSEEAFSIMALGGGTVPRVGLQYNWRFQLVQLTLLMLLAIVIYFAVPRFADSRTSISLATGLALLLVIAAITVPIRSLPTQRWLAAPAPVLTCAGSGPQLCLSPQHEHVRSTITENVNALTSAAKTARLTGILPARIIEMTGTNQADADGVTAWGLNLEEEQLRGQALDIQLFIINTIAPKTCEDITPAMDQALTRLASSLIISTGVEPRDVLFGSPEDHIIQSADEALAGRDLLVRCGR